jgi:two-component system, NarL family, sensor kinase
MRAKRPVKFRTSAAEAIKKLRSRIRELEETFSAIQLGHVDALVVNTPVGDNVFTLQGAEHPYRVLVENMNEGAATLDAEGTILYANSSFARILGVPLERVIGAPLRGHFPVREGERLHALMEDAFRSEVRGELRLGSSKGERLVRLSLSPVNEFEIRSICVVATDLTELSGANKALKASEDMLRNLSGRLLVLQDEERRRISRDLHDITGQKLALLSMDLSQILNSKKSIKHPDMQRILAEAISLSSESNEEIRTLSYVLHPPLLDELGLSCAVQWFTQGFESRTGIGVTVDIPSDLVRLAPDAEVALFRVVQESLTNVHRYSGSPTAFVRACSDGSVVTLEIGDSGKGMTGAWEMQNGESVSTLGVGIQGMKERLRQLSGRLDIASWPDKGTLVTATLPISVPEAEISENYDAANMSEPKTAQNRETAHPNGSRKRILIADDHEVLRRGIRTMLEGEPGLEICDEAVDGRDALEKTLLHGPDLVILDVNMPVLNGIEVCRQITLYKPKTKILVLSVHDSQKISKEVLVAGAQTYLSKSAAAEKLVNEVNALLNEQSQAQNA